MAAVTRVEDMMGLKTGRQRKREEVPKPRTGCGAEGEKEEEDKREDGNATPSSNAGYNCSRGDPRHRPLRVFPAPLRAASSGLDPDGCCCSSVPAHSYV